MEPQISVVMSVYGDFRFLHQAVDSILAQSFPDFEFLIVDDGCDPAADIGALARRDPRIRVLRNPANLGLARSLNGAIAQARSSLVARLDADDVSHPDRLAATLQCFERNPGMVLAGSDFVTIDETGKELELIRLPHDYIDCLWSSLFFNPFCHSAVTFRKAAFETVGGYDDSYPVAQDYDLWIRMMRLGVAANLGRPLAKFRLNAQGVTARRSGVQKTFAARARGPLWACIGLAEPENLDELAVLASGFSHDTAEKHALILLQYINIAGYFVRRIRRAHQALRRGDIRSFRETLARKASEFVATHGREARDPGALRAAVRRFYPLMYYRARWRRLLGGQNPLPSP